MPIESSSPAPYESDLAYIQDRHFSQFAKQSTAQIVGSLKQSPVPVVTVTDIGCGAGASTRALIEAGFQVIAVEPSAALLKVARAKAPGANFVQATAYDVELPPCDAVLALGEPLTYHAPGSDAVSALRGFFRTAHSALSPKGLLTFDLIVSGRECLALKTWSTGDDWALLVQVTEDHESSRLTREITTFRRRGATYRRRQERHSIRVFHEREITAMLEACGFDVEVDSRYGSVELLPRRRAFFATRGPCRSRART